MGQIVVPTNIAGTILAQHRQGLAARRELVNSFPVALAYAVDVDHGALLLGAGRVEHEAIATIGQASA